MQHGEVANCVLAVGSVGRARMLAKMLSPVVGRDELLMVDSSRGFLTVTGCYDGVPVSIITHLMGFGNLDIMLRETRAVVDGPMYIIRLGTCGSFNGKVRLKPLHGPHFSGDGRVDGRIFFFNLKYRFLRIS